MPKFKAGDVIRHAHTEDHFTILSVGNVHYFWRNNRSGLEGCSPFNNLDPSYEVYTPPRTTTVYIDMFLQPDGTITPILSKTLDGSEDTVAYATSTRQNWKLLSTKTVTLTEGQFDD